MQNFHYINLLKIRYISLFKFSILFFIISLFISIDCFAQKPHLNVFTLPDQYEDVKLTSIYRDEGNFIYAGSNKGLFRFDGSSFHHFNADSNFVKEVTCINKVENDILVGFVDGTIAKLQGLQLVTYQIHNYTNSFKVLEITSSIYGDVVICTDGAGLYYQTKDSLLHLTINNGLLDNTVNTAVFHNMKLFLGTDRGLNELSVADNKVVYIKSTNESSGLPDNLITDLKIDNQFVLWIAMYSKGVCSMSPNSGKIKTYNTFKNWQLGRVNKIGVINNELWLTAQKGLGVLNIGDEESYKFYDWKDETLIDRITDLYKDELNNVWFLDNSNRIYFTSTQFIFLTKHEGVYFGGSTSVYADSKGFLWFASGDTLFKHPVIFNNNNIMSKYLSFLSAKNTDITCIYEDVFGNVWVGTFDYGVYKINTENETIENYDKHQGLIDNSVLSIDGDEQNIWFATLGGLSAYSLTDNSGFTGYTKENGLPNSFIYDLEVDKNGNLWMATDGDGLVQFNGTNFIEISKNIDSEIKFTYSVIEDSKGKIWFSTSSQGIGRLENDTIIMYNQKSGLTDLNISGIVNDGLGNLIICNKKGIDIINYESGEVHNFGKEFGLDFTNSNINNISRDINNDIWIASDNSMVKYIYHQSPMRKDVPVRITGLSIFLNPVKMINDTAFSHDRNHVTINYTGFWFHEPAKVKYQYKLDGFDLDWQETSDKFATYSNLPPGQYIFNVRASGNNVFTKDSEVVQYSFAINKPFWKEAWFILLCILLVMALIYAYTKIRILRIQKLKEIEMERVQFQLNALRSQINPHFLFNSFNTLLSIMDEDKQKASKYVEKMSDFFRNILSVQEASAIPVKEELKLLSSYTYLEEERYGDNFSVEIKLDNNILQTLIPPLTFQLLVENCIKHNIISKNKPLKIKISSVNNHIQVENNIQPKITKPKSTGLGLENIKQRYAIVCSEPVTVFDDENNFIVHLPVINNLNG